MSPVLNLGITAIGINGAGHATTNPDGVDMHDLDDTIAKTASGLPCIPPAADRSPRYRSWSMCSSFRLVPTCILVAVFVGCASGPDYHPTESVVPASWHQELNNGQVTSPEELNQWWHQFNDPLLTALIEISDDENKNLQAAYWRIEQARAQRCIADSSRRPTLGQSGSFLHNKLSVNGLGLGGIPGLVIDSFDSWTWNLDIAWEPDLFGRVQRTVESAEASTAAQIEAYRDILVVLYGDIAQNYVQIRTLQAQLKFAKQNVSLQQAALDLATKRVVAGVSPNVDQFQAESNLASTQSEIPPLELQLHQALNRLSVLVGRYPGALDEHLAAVEPIPQPPEVLPVVVPCEVVRQRPDIRQAERLVAARTAEIGVAVADLYPRFTLGGSIGVNSQDFSSLFDSDSLAYGLGPSFTWPVFQGGRIRCNISQRRQAVEEAISTYEQALLLAFEEIENAIVGFNKQRIRHEALQRTVTASEKSLESVLSLYRAGKVDFQNVLDTLRTLFLAQNAMVVAEGQIVVQLVTLYRALGGGWDPDSHCQPRSSRLSCADRVPADLVEHVPTSNVVDRYFDTGDEDDKDDKDDKDDETDEDGEDDETDEDGETDEGLSSDEEDAGDQEEPTTHEQLEQLEKKLNRGREEKSDDPPSETNRFFNRTLKQLEERLNSTPESDLNKDLPGAGQPDVGATEGVALETNSESTPNQAPRFLVKDPASVSQNRRR